MKNKRTTHFYPLGIFSALCYMFIVYFGGYNSRTILDIKLKLSTILVVLMSPNVVKLQVPRYTGFQIKHFRISPISLLPLFFVAQKVCLWLTCTWVQNYNTYEKLETTSHYVNITDLIKLFWI